MSTPKPAVGTIGWVDLTVDDAESTRDFYAAAVGWKPEPVPMDGYADFNMTDASGTPRAGICHRRGPNAKVPPAWLVYFVVADLAASVEKSRALGAEILDGPRERLCVLRDPGGAVFALYQA